MTSLAPAERSPDTGLSGKIRVMVVDDSAVARGLVSRWIDEDSATEVCGRFVNGEMAISGIANAAPDVVLLDIDMPVMDGLTALPDLLRLQPGVKVIIVSTLTRRNAEISMKALSLGAIDYIPKPATNRGITTSMEFRSELLRKVKAVVPNPHVSPGPAGLDIPLPSSHEAISAGISGGTDDSSRQAITLRPYSAVKPRILAIGSSTGGPQALARVMVALTRELENIPVVITQHMPPTFTAILSEHLERSASRTVREGIDGEALKPGTVYVAPGGLHMTVSGKDSGPVLKIYDGEMINFCKPAIDPMFDSLAEVYGPSVLALVLTGMGHDGAWGACSIADHGGTVLAQDRETSVVWGMPRAAAAAGACAAVLPLDELINKVSELLSGGAR